MLGDLGLLVLAEAMVGAVANLEAVVRYQLAPLGLVGEIPFGGGERRRRRPKLQHVLDFRLRRIIECLSTRLPTGILSAVSALD